MSYRDTYDDWFDRCGPDPVPECEACGAPGYECDPDWCPAMTGEPLPPPPKRQQLPPNPPGYVLGGTWSDDDIPF